MRKSKTKKNEINARSVNNRYLLAGMAASSALILSRPLLPAFVYAVDANKYNWTKQNLNLVGGESISNAASSASGSNLIVSVYDFNSTDSALYVSNNYGSNWQNVADVADPGINHFWTSVDVSSNGQTMVAGSLQSDDPDGALGKIVVSLDAGVSWSDITADIPMSGGEPKVVVSGDGNTLAVGMSDKVYVSEDGGDNWTTTDVNGVGGQMALISLSISDNGNKLLFGGENIETDTDNVFLTEDGGDNWTAVDTPEQLFYPRAAILADGGTIAISGVSLDGGENDYAFISNNDGATWTDVTPNDDVFILWTSIAMSDDGDKIAMLGTNFFGGENSKMYVSGDSGANWTPEITDETNSGNIYDFYGKSNIDLNSSGSRAIVARVGGVYTGITKSPTAILADAQGGKYIGITTPEGTTITCSSATKESNLTEQDVSYNYPLGLVEFCFDTESEINQVSLTFVTDLKPNEVKARKYNSTTKTYFDIPNATITQTSYQGQAALLLTYTITDNGELDLDTADGSIKDPVGLALLTGQLADTGQAPVALLLLASSLISGAIITGLSIRPTRKFVGITASK